MGYNSVADIIGLHVSSFV